MCMPGERECVLCVCVCVFERKKRGGGGGSNICQLSPTGDSYYQLHDA